MEEGQTTHWPNEKEQTTIYKTLHRKLKIEPHYKTWMNSGAPEG
jgi:hypothetical protein